MTTSSSSSSSGGGYYRQVPNRNSNNVGNNAKNDLKAKLNSELNTNTAVFYTFNKNSIHYDMKLTETVLCIEAIDSIGLYRKWQLIIDKSFPYGTGRDMDIAALYRILVEGSKEEDQDLSLSFPQHNAVEEELRIDIKIKASKYLPEELFTVVLSSVELETTDQFLEMIKIRDIKIDELTKRVQLLEFRTSIGFSDLKDSSLSCSSYYNSHIDSLHKENGSRLNTFSSLRESCWSAQSNDAPNQWIQVDLGQIRTITAIATQGRSNISLTPNCNQWVTKYTLEFSDDGLHFTKKFKSLNEFEGNSDENSVVTHFLPNPVKSRYVRLIPLEYHIHISLRWNLAYC